MKKLTPEMIDERVKTLIDLELLLIFLVGMSLAGIELSD